MSRHKFWGVLRCPMCGADATNGFHRTFCNRVPDPKDGPCHPAQRLVGHFNYGASDGDPHHHVECANCGHRWIEETWKGDGL